MTSGEFYKVLLLPQITEKEAFHSYSVSHCGLFVEFGEFSSLKSVLPCYLVVTSGLSGQPVSLWHLCWMLRLGWIGSACECAFSLAAQRGQLRQRIRKSQHKINHDRHSKTIFPRGTFIPHHFHWCFHCAVPTQTARTGSDKTGCYLEGHSVLMVTSWLLDCEHGAAVFIDRVRSLSVSQPLGRLCNENYAPRYFMLKATGVCRWVSDVSMLPSNAWRSSVCKCLEFILIEPK